MSIYLSNNLLINLFLIFNLILFFKNIIIKMIEIIILKGRDWSA